MLEIADQMMHWYRRHIGFAVATVVGTSSSAPHPPGTSMAISETGEVAGSISGGCVEAATVALAELVLDSGQPLRESFGISTDDAFAVGLTCGGTIDVFVRRGSRALIDHLVRVRLATARQQPAALAVEVTTSGTPRELSICHQEFFGRTGNDALDIAIDEQIHQAITAGRNRLSQLSEPNEMTLFTHVFAPRPRMIIFGAVGYSAALSELAKLLGFHVTVCDARQTFTSRDRFPYADEVVVDWPHRYLETTEVDHRTVLCVMTHDPKFDLPVLETALRLPVAYIGAMGSRSVAATRIEELRARGISAAQLGRLHAPIGLDIGGSTPMETAVSIVAEIIAAREHNPGTGLLSGSGPIHRR